MLGLLVELVETNPACLSSDVGPPPHTGAMADIEIMELRVFEPRCLDCGETGPIETSVFFAMAWEEAHLCVAIRIGTNSDFADAADLAVAS